MLITSFILLFSLCTTIVAGDSSFDSPSIAGDVCISTLQASSPELAAGLSARKATAQKDAIEHFKRGRGEGPVDEADAQITAQEAAEGAKIGGDYTQSSSPVFAAGAAKELDPVKKTILTMCAAKRSAQGIAQNSAARADFRVAEIARQDVTPEGGTDTANAPKVIRLIDPNTFDRLLK